MDVWFDNVFSDVATSNRIGEARRRVSHVLLELSSIGASLDERGVAVRAELEGLRRERDTLLGASVQE
jgi:hypothetical protein